MNSGEAYPTILSAIAEHIRLLRLSPARREELVALLVEQAVIYRGLGTGEVERIRGFVLASFERLGLPETALPFVLEELETGYNPYTVAAAARALRGASAISDRAMAFLIAAAKRIEINDDYVQYETMDPADRTTPRSSALAEINNTISAIRGSKVSPGVVSAIDRDRSAPTSQAEGHCCCTTPPPVQLGLPKSPPDIEGLALEDQAGIAFTYRDFFQGRPSVVTFFYTRCMNPRKCSLTISKLAALQARLALMGLASHINIGAFTYDPAYDRAARLQMYGMDRGFKFDDHNRFIRTVGSFEPVQANFNLGVGFGPATTNRHSVELLILDANCKPVYESRRALWEEDDVLRAIEEVVGAKKQEGVRDGQLERGIG
ncbi:SCO family protein [Bradyrhizobium sp. HKCCYLS3077]|uniref:SCO family protein n=1 Tax=Bradyrhizobium sp. HKCCYLS3077 TaxID=3420761 RepID=UPI003EBA02B0